LSVEIQSQFDSRRIEQVFIKLKSLTEIPAGSSILRGLLVLDLFSGVFPHVP
jgi:hypothetical protein